jgi:uncharacterized protein DUF6666
MRRPKRIAWSGSLLLCVALFCSALDRRCAVASDSFPGGIRFDTPSELVPPGSDRPLAAGVVADSTPPVSDLAPPAVSDWFTSVFGNADFGPADGCPVCENCPKIGFYGFFGYDSWHGVQDGGHSNTGLNKGLNFATRLGPVSDWTGIGFQLGGSVGVYNFSGTNYHLTHQDEVTPQGFVTYGFFRKANEQSNFSGAVVQDWMFNSNYGVLAQNPTLAQWRGQLGYALGPSNELGVWASWRGQGDTRLVSGVGSTAWRPVEQLNAYWHHKWQQGGADTWLWFGVPDHDRLVGGGSLGDYLAGALATCPLSDCLVLYSQLTYMHPSAAPGPGGSSEEAWNFTVGLTYFHGRNARTTTVAGQCWMPQLPVANNGTFLVDTSRTR